MTELDRLSPEERHLLMWVAEAETGLLEPIEVSLADLPALELVDAVVDRLVLHGLLDREWQVGSHFGHRGLCVYLTDQGAHAVAELWRRQRSRKAQGSTPMH